MRARIGIEGLGEACLSWFWPLLVDVQYMSVVYRDCQVYTTPAHLEPPSWIGKFSLFAIRFRGDETCLDGLVSRFYTACGRFLILNTADWRDVCSPPFPLRRLFLLNSLHVQAPRNLSRCHGLPMPKLLIVMYGMLHVNLSISSESSGRCGGHKTSVILRLDDLLSCVFQEFLSRILTTVTTTHSL